MKRFRNSNRDTNIDVVRKSIFDTEVALCGELISSVLKRGEMFYFYGKAPGSYNNLTRVVTGGIGITAGEDGGIGFLSYEKLVAPRTKRCHGTPHYAGDSSVSVEEIKYRIEVIRNSNSD